MPLTNDINRWEYTGDGVTPDFAYENLIFAASDLEVYFDEVLQVSGYTVSNVGVVAGGNVTPTPIVPAGVKIVIVRAVPFTQPQDFVDNESVDAQAFEDGLNRMTILAQQIRDTIGRQVTLSTAEPTGADMTVPALATRLGQYWGWDAILGSLVAFGPPAGTTAVSVFMTGVITAADAATARAALDAVGYGFKAAESSPAAMTVDVAAGAVFNSITGLRSAISPQTTGVITAPSVNPRIDIVYIDRLTGVVGVETGTEGASPSDPTISADKLPVARVTLATSTTGITDSLIDDIRELGTLGYPGFIDEDDFASDSASHVPTQQSAKAYVEASSPRGHIDGLIISNNSGDAAKDLDIAAGAARDGGDAVTIKLAASITKQLDAAWAVGTDAGALDGTESVGGTPDADTWYHIWLIRRSDTGVVDVLASESATSPSMPTNYDQKRRIGAVLFDATPDILAFTQYGDRFEWVTRALDYNNLSPGTSAVTVTVSTPLGLKIQALLTAGITNNASVYVLYTSMDAADVVPDATNFDLNVNSAYGHLNMERMTNTSSQIRLRSSDGVISGDFKLDCLGWIDPRGRNAA